jgi:transcriptional regulator with XRE-family HTH domain
MEAARNRDEIYKRIGERMQQARREARGGRGYTQQEMARLMDVTPITLSRWETGTRQPSFAALTRFAELVGKPMAYFFEEEPQQDDYSQALLRIMDDLTDDDRKEIVNFARFRYKQWYDNLTAEE